MAKVLEQLQRFRKVEEAVAQKDEPAPGEPDPFKGDALNQRVRDSAKETLEILAGSVVQTAPAAMAQGRIQGFGSSIQTAGPTGAGGSTTTSTASTGSRMVGFGSSSAPPPQASNIASTATGVLNNIYKGATSMTQSAWGGSSQQTERLHQASSYTASTPPPAQYMPSSWQGHGGGYLDHSALTAQVVGAEQQLVDEVTAQGGLRVLPDPEDLRRFVASVSNMDGLRIGELLREKMDSPAWQVCLKAMCALEAIIMEGSSQACGEAAIMFQSDVSPLHRALQSPQGQVREKGARLLELLTGEKVQVTAPAAPPKKVVPKTYMTGSSAPTQPAASSWTAPQSNGSSQADLLSVDDGPDLLGGAASVTAPAPQATPAAPQAPVDALFSGLDVPTSPPQAAAPAPDTRSALPEDLFGPLDSPATVPAAGNGYAAPTTSYAAPAGASHNAGAMPGHVGAAAPQPGQGRSNDLADMFAGLSTSSSGPAPPVQHQGYLGAPMPSQANPAPQQQHQQQAHQIGDLLGGMDGPTGPAPSQPAVASAPGGGMGGMPGMPAGMVPGQMMPYMMPNGQMAYMPVMAPGAGMMPGMVPGYYPGGAMPQQAGMVHQGMMGMQQGMTAQAGLPQGMMQPGAMQQGMVPQGMMNPGMMQQGMMQQRMPGMQQGMMAPQQGAYPGLATMGAAAGSKPATWQGNDDLSNLMRNVASGGKHDPAFDFISNELKPKK